MASKQYNRNSYPPLSGAFNHCAYWLSFPPKTFGPSFNTHFSNIIYTLGTVLEEQGMQRWKNTLEYWGQWWHFRSSTIIPQRSDTVAEPGHTKRLTKGHIPGLFQAILNKSWLVEGIPLSLHMLRWLYKFQIFLSECPPRPSCYSPAAAWFAEVVGSPGLGLQGKEKREVFFPGRMFSNSLLCLFLFVMHCGYFLNC